MTPAARVREARELAPAEIRFLRDRPGSLWQDPEWARFMRATGNGCFWAVAEDDAGPLGLALVTEKRRRFGLSYAYVGRGPIAATREAGRAILRHLAGRGYLYVQIDPPAGFDPGDLKLRPVRRGIHPPDTIVVDLERTEEAMLASFSATARRHIRKAEAAGCDCSVRKGSGGPDFAAFMRLMELTSRRKGLRVFGERYYAAMLETLDAELFVARVGGEASSAAILLRHRELALYYYGASDPEASELSSSYFLQWTMMRRARALGCRGYDLCGVSPPGARGHYLEGVTAFKERFGGARVALGSSCAYVGKPLRYLAASAFKGGLRRTAPVPR